MKYFTSQVFTAVLMYDILEKLSERFEEKEVELILLILRSVGFSLRKDNPLALKELILRLQQMAGEATHCKNR
jgi:nucleolar MIF4G domain-containing protein 1